MTKERLDNIEKQLHAEHARILHRGNPDPVARELIYGLRKAHARIEYLEALERVRLQSESEACWDLLQAAKCKPTE